jgi:hypothetical protein
MDSLLPVFAVVSSVLALVFYTALFITGLLDNEF